jgi:hypothetical protein
VFHTCKHYRIEEGECSVFYLKKLSNPHAGHAYKSRLVTCDNDKLTTTKKTLHLLCCDAGLGYRFILHGVRRCLKYVFLSGVSSYIETMWK